MKGIQEQLRRLLNQGDIINPKNSIPAGGDGEQQVIVPLVFNLDPEKQAVVLDENGQVVEPDAPRVQYSKLIREHDYINPGARKAEETNLSIVPNGALIVIDNIDRSKLQMRSEPIAKPPRRKPLVP